VAFVDKVVGRRGDVVSNRVAEVIMVEVAVAKEIRSKACVDVDIPAVLSGLLERDRSDETEKMGDKIELVNKTKIPALDDLLPGVRIEVSCFWVLLETKIEGNSSEVEVIDGTVVDGTCEMVLVLAALRS
jgi:hypothetical protein